MSQQFWKPYIYELLQKNLPQIITWHEERLFNKKFPGILASKDNQKIPRHPQAGTSDGATQTMHNGIKIHSQSYGNATNKRKMAELFEKNRGVHEPSEEYAFQVLLENMEPGSAIVELGAWWSFYSMWFCKAVKDGRAFLIEPLEKNLDSGRKNFDLNGLDGDFTQAFAGKKSGFWYEPRRSIFYGTKLVETRIPIITIDDFMKSKSLERIDILHADIQGAEVDMLLGAEKSLDHKKIGYLCISTHTDELHSQCLNYLQEKNYKILCEVDLTSCAHMDGFFVARAPNVNGPDKIEIDKAPAHKG